ncbi:MAG: 6,7-dimethyl-8-ribityllumazine synthase [Gammaproteobacteria bacterium]|nr:6,7-dimethyl-8-ribityllumazine synthase [Gammaproteobacteria bacterium]
MTDSVEKTAPAAPQRQLYDASFCIVAARFNDSIVSALIAGAKDTLLRYGVSASAIDVLRVAGAFELPLAAQKAAATGRYDGLIALGAVIRGGTPHFEDVSGECMAGLSRVALETGIPMGNGVLTVDSVTQATDRAGGSEGNKGAEAALAAIEMVHLVRDLGG